MSIAAFGFVLLVISIFFFSVNSSLFIFYVFVCVLPFSLFLFCFCCCCYFLCSLVCLHPKTMFVGKTYTNLKNESMLQKSHVESIFSLFKSSLPFWYLYWHCPVYSNTCSCLCLPINVLYFWHVRVEYGWRHLKNGFVRISIKILWWECPNRSEWYSTCDMRAACYKLCNKLMCCFLGCVCFFVVVVGLVDILVHSIWDTKHGACMHTYMKRLYRQFAVLANMSTVMKRLLLPAIESKCKIQRNQNRIEIKREKRTRNTQTKCNKFCK